MLNIAVLKERLPSESRVAASPESVKKLTTLGLNVMLEAGAGEKSFFSDTAYQDAGAAIFKSRESLLKEAQVILKVRSPLLEDLKLDHFPSYTTLICLADILNQPEDKQVFEQHNISVVALEMMPRITRAQSMDVLSSQSNLLGYKAVLEAANLFSRAFPMMMTAAGTLFPAKVLVIGAGVAGLQAIATARRLGAVVYGYDVRPTTKEQVESLGASFVEVEGAEKPASKGGYAQEAGEDYKARQEAKLSEVVPKMDIIITTALIPGKPAPRLITQEMVERMKAGSLILDLAGEKGGNCTLSQYGKLVRHQEVQIFAPENLIAQLAFDASTLYAKNILNFITAFYDAEKKELILPESDEIIAGCLITKKVPNLKP